MSRPFWQAKIRGLLEIDDPDHDQNPLWRSLASLEDWPETANAAQMISLANHIAAASDRGAIDALLDPSDENTGNLEIAHLLSGKKLPLQLPPQGQRSHFLAGVDLNDIPESIRQEKENPQKVFWWLWRCLPAVVSQENPSLLLAPADRHLPDSSVWSHTSMTSALVGALIGYHLRAEELSNSADYPPSRPYLATFTFTPIQELIKASRKMRDFWSGSWILHYLSAKVCWKLAQLYGPDCLVYPSLFQQPLIDHWLLQQWSEFSEWIPKPEERGLLTAGFPNVLVLVLPQERVQAAMQTAEQTLKAEWRNLGKEVFQFLKGQRHWMPELQSDSSTWNQWLDAVWQTYWTALPIGSETEPALTQSLDPEGAETGFTQWVVTQNRAFRLPKENQLFRDEQDKETVFVRAAQQASSQDIQINVGSWWPYVFDQTRLALTSVKSARTWKVPTAFGPRSTVSGIGPVVHPPKEKGWVTEAETKKFWRRQVGLFDGSEQLNVTETIKRCLHLVLPKLLETDQNQVVPQRLKLDQDKVDAAYPDLTAGVAGYLKTHNQAHDTTHLNHFQQVCQVLAQKFPIRADLISTETPSLWGISWIDNPNNQSLRPYPSRFLNAGWLTEELEDPDLNELEDSISREQDPKHLEELNSKFLKKRAGHQQAIQAALKRYYPSGTPADWYVLAAGDGDGMSQWLKGILLKEYDKYISKKLLDGSAVHKNPELWQAFSDFAKHQQKRMGPSTHGALSRALLDFSNQLVPYLTEQRYAGRLIYGGGDDVLAYTNLWEWDRWLWDIRQCFRGDKDPDGKFSSQGDYWHWQDSESLPDRLHNRPLFTMGSAATISFGIVIAHHSVPLAIALENLWEAEDEAKKHYCPIPDPDPEKEEPAKKDAVQVRVIYGNGNILKATSKFMVFNQWRSLLEVSVTCEQETSLPALFEQAAQVWEQHPAPMPEAILPWATAFCDRRDLFQEDEVLKQQFRDALTSCLQDLWNRTPEKDRDREIQTWLKLAAFILRNRHIKLGV